MREKFYKIISLLLSITFLCPSITYGNKKEVSTYKEDEILVAFKDSVKEKKAYSIAENLDSNVVEKNKEDNYYIVKIDDDVSVDEAIDKFEKNDSVKYVQPNFIYNLEEDNKITTNDPLSQYHINQINLDKAWSLIDEKSQNIKVAVIDTGVDPTHRDLVNNIDSAVDAMNDFKPLSKDTANHGTHVSGIIAAQCDNNLGVAGAAYNKADLMVINVFQRVNYKNIVYTSDLIRGYNYAVEHGARVINMSLGRIGIDEHYDYILEDAINNAKDKGVVTVSSAGNECSSEPHYPSDFESCISVTATNQNDKFDYTYSNYGPQKDIAAPGTNIRSTTPKDTYGYNSGTSMASPIVSGVVALMLSKSPSLNVEEIKNILYSTAVDLGKEGRDDEYGWGRINPYEAMLKVSKGIVSSTDISLDKKEININKGDKTTIKGSLTPKNTTDIISWSSSDDSIAEVDDKGVIKGISVGDVVITAKSTSAVKATCKVSVKSPLEKIKLNKSSEILNKGEESKLQVTYNPEDTTDNKEVVWTSSDENIVKVNDKGVVIGVNPGSAIATAKVGDLQSSCKFTVLSPLLDINLDYQDISLQKGTSEKLILNYNPSDTTDNKNISWISSDENVVTVDETGSINAMNTGTAQITAIVNNKKSACKVEVEDNNSVKLNMSSISINKNKEVKLKVLDEFNNEIRENISWSSSNKYVADVDDTGKIMTKSQGSTIITAKIGDLTLYCTVNVLSPLSSINLEDKYVTLNRYKERQLNLIFSPGDTTDKKEVVWTSSDKSIVSVSKEGIIKGLKSGKAVITAQVGNLLSSCEVNVKSPLINIYMDKEKLQVNRSESEQLNITYNPIDTTDSKDIVWTSSDENIATVDDNGNVKGISLGNVIISAKVGDKTAKSIVKVVAPIRSIGLNKKEITLENPNEETLTPIFYPNDTTDDKNVKWKSLDENIAIVDKNGKVTPIGSGITVIEATSSNNMVARCTVTVNMKLLSIEFPQKEAEICVGDNYTQQLNFNPSSIKSDNIEWSTSNPDVATVDGNGRITGKSKGSCEITAKVEDLKATFKINVLLKQINKFTVNSAITDSSKTIIKGIGEVGFIIRAYINNKQIGSSSKVKSDGTYILSIPAQKPSSKITVKISKSGYSTKIKSIYNKTKFINKLEVNSIKTSHTKIKGKGSAGATVKVYVNGKQIGKSSTIKKDKTFELTIPKQKPTTNVEIKMSKKGYVTQYVTKKVLKVFTANFTINKVKNTHTKITGRGSKNSNIRIYDKSKLIGKGRVNEKGYYSIKIPKHKSNKKITVKMSKDGYATLLKTIIVK